MLVDQCQYYLYDIFYSVYDSDGFKISITILWSILVFQYAPYSHQVKKKMISFYRNWTLEVPNKFSNDLRLIILWKSKNLKEWSPRDKSL